MTVQTDPDIPRQEAAAWFAKLNQRKVTLPDITAFSAWRRTPENAAAYARIEAMWSAAKTLSVDPDIAALTAQAKRGVDRPARSSDRWARLLKPAGAIAGGLVLAAAGTWLTNQHTVYDTAIGERRTVRLADGSELTLDTASRAQVRMTRGRREVRLTAGQAYFEVAKNPDRPFVVIAGDTSVVALGTRFDVRRVADGARVVLVEGRVRVEAGETATTSWTLRPGQQISTNAASPSVRSADAVAVTSWTTGRLTFNQTRLAAAIAEINRYSDKPVVLDAPGVAEETVNGVFDTDDRDGFLAALADLYGLRASSRADGSIVLSIGEAAPGENIS